MNGCSEQVGMGTLGSPVPCSCEQGHRTLREEPLGKSFGDLKPGGLWPPEPPVLPAGGPTEEKVLEVSDECFGIKVPQFCVPGTALSFPEATRKESPVC